MVSYLFVAGVEHKMVSKCLWLVCLCVCLSLVACSTQWGDLEQQVEPLAVFGEHSTELLEDEHPAGTHSPPTQTGWSVYTVSERMRIVNHGPGQADKHNLWLALIQDITPYQEVLSMQVSPENYQVTTDEYGNRYAEFDLSGLPAGEEVLIQADYQVRVNSLSYELWGCGGDLPEFYTQPELHVESHNPQIRRLSERLSEGSSNTCKQVAAFYDYIGDNLIYSYNGADWGAQAALGEMGADCSEYASLMMALSRAAGIPARYLEGLYETGEASDELARTEHAWLEVYLPGVGWTPMDPTVGRKALNRDKYFAAMPADHIVVTRGRNPSTLRGGSYWTHIYWPGNSTDIKVYDFVWMVEPQGG
jgi:transglutaminase-like putative cysteine protease